MKPATLGAFAVITLTGACTSPQSLPVCDATTPVAREDGWWSDRHEMTSRAAENEEARIYFIGDSITQSWEAPGAEVWEEFYGERNAVNLGISGDRTQHVLWRLQNGALGAGEPELAVLMIGTNNVRADPPEETAAGVTAIVNDLREQLPTTEILLLAVFPRGENAQHPDRLTNDAVNERIAKLGHRDRVHFLDIGAHLMEEDGSLSVQIMPDLLHLSPTGYRRWAEAIEPSVERLLDR